MIANTDALIYGHFELLGGDHADTFIKFSRIAERSTALETTTQWLLPSVAAWLPDVVVAPATAGVALGWTLARRLGLPLVLADVGADGRAVAVPDAESLRDHRALLVNDVVTTGRGMTALAQVANNAGATVAGATWFLSYSVCPSSRWRSERASRLSGRGHCSSSMFKASARGSSRDFTGDAVIGERIVRRTKART
jgi:orotate phosphoribosyltransferase